MAQNPTQNKWRGRAIAYAPLFLWIGVIFFFSSSQGSMTETSRIIRPILEFFFPGALEETLVLYHGYIRKFAHFAEYAILALFAFRAFSLSMDSAKAKNALFASLGLVSVISISDEFNQSLVASRTASVFDVLLDISGGVATLILIWLFGWRRPSVPRNGAQVRS